MGLQVIKQPEPNRYAIWSNTSDSLIAVDLTRAQIVDHFATAAKQAAREAVLEQLASIDRGEDPYFGDGMSWGQMKPETVPHGT